MLSRKQLDERRAVVNRGATYIVLNPVAKTYHNRAMRRNTTHKVHRSKWSKWSAKLGKTIQVLPKIYRTA